MPKRQPRISDEIADTIRENMHLWTGTAREFSQELFDLMPYRTRKSWENCVYRFKNMYGDEVPTNTKCQASRHGGASMDEGEQYIVDSPYYYNRQTDVYVTFLRSVGGKPITVSGDTHRAMKEAYSNMVGGGATINEISRNFQFPRAWFDEYRRLHGWTHDMDPYTDEEIEDFEVEDLVDDLVLRQRRSLHIAYEKRKWKDIQTDADKWRTFEDTVMEQFKHQVSKAQKVPKLKMRKHDEPYALVVSPTDFHWGKFGWEDETGETYNFEEAEKRLMSKTEELVARLPYQPEKIILATGSDWFHVDNDAGGTTRGTPMGTSSCSSPAEILITGCELAKRHIDLLRQVAPVDVVFMAGNHDRFSALTLALYLRASYEGVDDCEVHMTVKTRHYHPYGNTLIGFTHGDTVKQLRLPSLMAQEQWEAWGEHQHKVWFSGHFHHQSVKEDGGATCIILPSLAANDRWHARMGYKSQAGLSGHFIDKEKGLIGSMFCPVLDD